MPWQRGLALTGQRGGWQSGGAEDSSSSIPAAPNLARHSLRECHVARLSSASRMKSFLRFPRYSFESQTTSTLSSSSCRQTLKTSHLPHLEARTLKADGIHSASCLRISTSTRKDFPISISFKWRL